jgi:integrase
MPLTNTACANAKPQEKPYRKADGQGMYLEVMPNGSKYWRMKYRYAGKEKRLSIGVYPDVSLAQARETRAAAKELLKQHIDPSQKKQQQKQQIYKEAGETFQHIAEHWYERQKQSWKPQHAEKTWRRIEMHVFPSIGKIPVKQLTAQDIIRCIQRIEDSGAADIAKRAFQNIKRILDYAVIEQSLPQNFTHSIRSQDILRRTKVKHNPHLEAHELPDYLRAVENYDGELQTKLALKLMMLVFIRHNELLNARWDEFIFDRSEWRIPAERMKMDKPHIVPLSRQAMNILEQLKALNGVFEFVFPQKRNPRKPMSNGAMTNALHRMGYKGKLTVHGMRGTASTILNENGFNPDAIEIQQSRQDQNKVRASYNHAQYLDERRQMMQWWADYIDNLSS